jgi:hypothetical protein
MSNHVNVVICTPGFNLMGVYVKSLLATIDQLNKRGISWAYSNEYSSHVADARETTASGTKVNSYTENTPFAGVLTYDKMFWIDSDIVWTPEDFIKLYESDKDVVSGAYCAPSGEVMAYPEMLRSGYAHQQVLEMTDPIEIEGIGFGFVCVKKGVFESLSRPWFQSTSKEALDEEGNTINLPIMGEDLSWCERVRKNGFKIWFDPKVQLTHHKTVRLTLQGMREM